MDALKNWRPCQTFKRLQFKNGPSFLIPIEIYLKFPQALKAQRRVAVAALCILFSWNTSVSWEASLTPVEITIFQTAYKLRMILNLKIFKRFIKNHLKQPKPRRVQ